MVAAFVVVPSSAAAARMHRACGTDTPCQALHLPDGTAARRLFATVGYAELSVKRAAPEVCVAAQHFLYLLPDPQGHGSLRPTLDRVGIGAGAESVTSRSPRDLIHASRRANRWR